MRRILSLSLFSLFHILCSCEMPEGYDKDACLLIASQHGNNSYKYYYDRHNRLIHITRISPSRLDDREYQIEYNQDGLVSKYALLDQYGRIYRAFEYEYNAANQIVQKNVFAWKDFSVHFQYPIHYEYNDAGQLTREYASFFEVRYEYVDATEVIQYVDGGKSVLEYDDKPHPFSQQTGNFPDVVKDFPVMTFHFALDHNMISKTTGDGKSGPNAFSIPNFSASYIYRSDGLPLEGTILLPNGNTREEAFVYSCDI